MDATRRHPQEVPADARGARHGGELRQRPGPEETPRADRHRQGSPGGHEDNTGGRRKKYFVLLKILNTLDSMSAGCGAVLREVRVCEARPRAPLLRVRRVRAQDGPPLPLGQQLRRLLQLQGEYWPLIGPHTHTV